MSALILFGRTLLALGVVLGLIWGLARLARRGQSGGLRRRPGRMSRPGVELVSRVSLSRTSSIAVIRVGDRALVVGTTPQSVTLIAEIATSELDPESPNNDSPWMAESKQSTTAWDASISKLRELTVRR